MMIGPTSSKNMAMARGKQSGGEVKPNPTLVIVQDVIADVTGVEPMEVTLDSDLEQDLGIDMITEFTAIITQLKKRIPELASLPRQQFADCMTVAELIEMIDDEREL